MRTTLDYLPSSIHGVDSQGDSLARFVRYKEYNLDAEDLFIIQNFISPDWLIHTMITESDDPKGFVIDRYDNRCLYDGGRDITGMAIGDAHDPQYIEGSLQKFVSVRDRGAISLTKETIALNPNRVYMRYMTPMVTWDGQVKILIACRYQEIEKQSVENSQDLSEVLKKYNNQLSECVS